MNRKKMVTVMASITMLMALNTSPSNIKANEGKIQKLKLEQVELEKKSRELFEDIGKSEKEVKSLDKEMENLLDEIAKIKDSILELEVEIKEQEVELIRVEDEIKDLEKDIEELEVVIKERDGILAEQARGIQTGAAPSDIVDILIESESLSEVIGKVNIVNTLINNNNNIMEEQKRDQDIVKSQKESLVIVKKESLRVKEGLEESKKELAKEKGGLDTKLAYVEEEYNINNNEMNDLVKGKKGLDKEIEEVKGSIQKERNLIAQREEEEERERKTVSIASSKVSSTEEVTGSTDVPVVANTEGWVRPANGSVSSEFGYRIHPIYGTRKLHEGIDISGSGAIRAAKGGKVVTASNHSTYGNHVVIDHGGGLRTLYAHMIPGLSVSVGQEVTAGQTLGTMGTTGASTGVHLHFEVHQNGGVVNPRAYINF